MSRRCWRGGGGRRGTRSVAGDCGQTGDDASDLPGREPFPDAENDEHPGESDADADGSFAGGALFGEGREYHEGGGQRGDGVDDAGQDRRHLGLTESEQAEGDAVEQQSHYREVLPRPTRLRESNTSDTRHDQQGGGSEQETHEGNLDWRKGAQSELDPPE